jgi:putative endonuclease
MKRQATGVLGEQLAADLVTRCGYSILETNYRVREGEADIIAMDGDCLVCIEVRTKTSRVYGTPEESLTRIKKAHLAAVINRYMEKMLEQPVNWRIDLVAVEMDDKGKVKRIDLIKNAVEED